MTTDTAPTFAAIAEQAHRSAERAHRKAVDDLASALGQDASYAITWLAETAVAARTRLELWAVADLHGAAAMTGRLADRLNANDLRSSDPFARAVAEGQRRAALAVLRDARPYVDAGELVDRLV